MTCDDPNCVGGLSCPVCYLAAFRRVNDPATALPRRSPSPCHDGCPGWFVEAEVYTIHRCDDCWVGQGPLQATDHDYECHPVCVLARHALLLEKS